MIFDSEPKSGRPISRPDFVLFLVQNSLIFIVVCVSLMNLSINVGHYNLWTLLLTSTLGYIMPNPRIKLIPEELRETNKCNTVDES